VADARKARFVGIPIWFRLTAMGVLVCLLTADLVLVARRPRTPTFREAGAWVACYVVLALAFAVGVALVGGAAAGSQFVAGWLTEYSLSVDNLFVFVLLMSRFAVPEVAQQKVLMIGIIVSLVLRGGFILIGAELIDRFGAVLYLFGGFLVYSAARLVREAVGGREAQVSGEPATGEKAVVAVAVGRALGASGEYDGARLRTRSGGRAVFTPLVVVFVAIGTTDLLFAFDSIPAIFGLTRDPFIVFSATVFALMGLRQLYFLLGGLLARLEYLSWGLAAILGFIGVKLICEALRDNELPFVNSGDPVGWAPRFSTLPSLGVIAAALALTAVASLPAGRRRTGRPASPRS